MSELPTIILEEHWPDGDWGWNCVEPGDPNYVVWLAWVSDGCCPGTANPPGKFGIHMETHDPCPLLPHVDKHGSSWGRCQVTGIWLRTEYVDPETLTERYVQRTKDDPPHHHRRGS